MNGIQWHRSNRMELLVRQLGDALARSAPDPLVPERIVVQSLGVRRWLLQKLADRHGVGINLEMPFPQVFFDELTDHVVGKDPRTEHFAVERLTWRLYGLLPQVQNLPEFAEVRNYLEGEAVSLKRYQLAGRLARLYDQYFLYRPSLLLEWDRRGNEWPAVLWRRLSQGAADAHPAARRQQLLARLHSREPRMELDGQKIFFFGITTLPPVYVHILEALARHTEIHLFSFQPTREYWGDILPEKKIARKLANRPADQDAEALHLEAGHPLLASMGRVGQEFFQLLMGVDPQPQEIDLFEPPPGDHLLAQIQRDILRLDASHPLEWKDRDRSIQIHSCHSPMREVEVLKDQLLDLFNHDPTLCPRDVVIMTPDIENYAPLIEAVFGTSEEGVPAIPYSISDRSPRRTSGMIDCFLSILELGRSRFSAAEVFTLLEHEAFRHQFELTDEDLEPLRTLIQRAGIFWGVDAKHREGFGMPLADGGTWRDGLRKALLGFAMESDGEKFFEGYLPMEGVGGETAQRVGCLAKAIRQLDEARSRLNRPQPLAEWRETTNWLLQNLLKPGDEDEYDLGILRQGIAGLKDLQGELQDPVPLEVIHAHLVATLDATETHTGFLSGRVTFAALKPMRSLPFRVVGLLGINDGDFPRQDRNLEFDRMTEKHEPGDRSVREDDRYLFLESLLAAREIFYVSYVGQSDRTAAEYPPSVVVNELIDVIRQGTRADLARLVVKHRLHGFSPRYFGDDPRWFSYSRNAEAAARVVVARPDQADRQPFLAAPLPPPREMPVEIRLDELLRFFRNPAEFFVKQRLDFRLPEAAEALPDSEPFALDRLNEYRLSDFLLDHRQGKDDRARLLPLARERFQLPYGGLGGSIYDGTHRQVRDLLAQLGDWESIPQLDFDIDLGDSRLTGRLKELTNRGQVRIRCGKIRGIHRLHAWIQHLVLQVGPAVDCPRSTILISPDEQVEFVEVKEAGRHLRDLVAIYQQGHLEPIRLFPRSSCSYVEMTREAKPSSDRIMRELSQLWQGSEYDWGESRDAYLDLCFHRGDPFDGHFEEIARRVYGPLLDHVKPPSDPPKKPSNSPKSKRLSRKK